MSESLTPEQQATQAVARARAEGKAQAETFLNGASDNAAKVMGNLAALNIIIRKVA